MEPIYIKSNAVIFRQENTIYITSEEIGKQQLPIKGISEIYCLGKVTIKSGAALYLMNEGIPVHFYNKYGGYIGSLMPKDDLISGKIVIAQARHNLDRDLRLFVARNFVIGTINSMITTLKYYKSKGKDVSDFITSLREIQVTGSSPSELMGIEGQAWQIFYNAYNTISISFKITHREYRPPPDPLNSLISLANSMLYTTVLSEIRKTYLHPAISFLHEPLERRYSLALDLADIFKPLISARVVLRLVNLKQIQYDDFLVDVGYRLKEDALTRFIQTYNNRIEETIKHPKLKRKVSYRYLIRLECYKLVKHFLNDRKYTPFKLSR